MVRIHWVRQGKLGIKHHELGNRQGYSRVGWSKVASVRQKGLVYCEKPLLYRGLITADNAGAVLTVWGGEVNGEEASHYHMVHRWQEDVLLHLRHHRHIALLLGELQQVSGKIKTGT